MHRILLTLPVIILMLAGQASAVGETTFLDYSDDTAGFALQYPSNWTVVENVNTMISVQDGTIDVIHQEDLSSAERGSYKVMVHVDGSPRYVSNVLVMVRPFEANVSPYDTSEDASLAVKSDFERTMASGTYFLEDTYLGNSHAWVYRRTMNVPQWDDQLRITYYLTASKTKAYMMIETVMMSKLADPVYADQFNQVIQSFRVTQNESSAIDPSLDWGAIKPGSEDVTAENQVGQTEIHENFDNNALGWPTGNNASVADGRYVLNSMDGYPFTVRNTGLGQITFDFSYQAQVEFLDGNTTAGYGLVFGYMDENNYYAFLVTKSGQFLVVQEKDGEVINLVPWTSSPLLMGTSHTLLVQGDYQTLNEGVVTHRYATMFYVDGEQVCRTDITNVLSVSGWFGLFVSEGMEVAFDSLVSRNFLVDGVMTLDRIDQ